MSDITQATVNECYVRCRNRCEACGGGVICERGYVALHHRKRRGYGDHSAANLMVVHPSCHNLHQGSIHQNPARSRRLGHILYDYQDPTEVPVIVARDLLELRA